MRRCCLRLPEQISVKYAIEVEKEKERRPGSHGRTVEQLCAHAVQLEHEKIACLKIAAVRKFPNRAGSGSGAPFRCVSHFQGSIQQLVKEDSIEDGGVATFPSVMGQQFRFCLRRYPK